MKTKLAKSGLVALLAGVLSLSFLGCKKEQIKYLDEYSMLCVKNYKIPGRDLLSMEDYVDRTERIRKLDSETAKDSVNNLLETFFYITSFYTEQRKSFDKTLSFSKIHMGKKKLNCEDAMIVAAALLNENGFPAYGLRIVTDSGYDHCVFVYKTPEKTFGSVGGNDFDNELPVHKSLGSLAFTISGSGKFKGRTSYSVIEIKREYPHFLE